MAPAKFPSLYACESDTLACVVSRCGSSCNASTVCWLVTMVELQLRVIPLPWPCPMNDQRPHNLPASPALLW